MLQCKEEVTMSHSTSYSVSRSASRLFTLIYTSALLVIAAAVIFGMVR